MIKDILKTKALARKAGYIEASGLMDYRLPGNIGYYKQYEVRVLNM